MLLWVCSAVLSDLLDQSGLLSHEHSRLSLHHHLLHLPQQACPRWPVPSHHLPHHCRPSLLCPESYRHFPMPTRYPRLSLHCLVLPLNIQLVFLPSLDSHLLHCSLSRKQVPRWDLQPLWDALGSLLHLLGFWDPLYSLSYRAFHSGLRTSQILVLGPCPWLEIVISRLNLHNRVKQSRLVLLDNLIPSCVMVCDYRWARYLLSHRPSLQHSTQQEQSISSCFESRDHDSSKLRSESNNNSEKSD